MELEHTGRPVAVVLGLQDLRGVLDDVGMGLSWYQP